MSHTNCITFHVRLQQLLSTPRKKRQPPLPAAAAPCSDPPRVCSVEKSRYGGLLVLFLLLLIRHDRFHSPDPQATECALTLLTWVGVCSSLPLVGRGAGEEEAEAAAAGVATAAGAREESFDVLQRGWHACPGPCLCLCFTVRRRRPQKLTRRLTDRVHARRGASERKRRTSTAQRCTGHRGSEK